MDVETFAKCLEPALEYYGHTMTEQVWDFYFTELGGMKVPELETAVRLHMASLKSFPLTSHLRPERKAAIFGRKKRTYDQHPDYNRTFVDCINLFHARIGGSVWAGIDSETTYPIEIEPVIAQAVAYYNDQAAKLGELVAASQCRGGISQRLIKEFEHLSYYDD